MPLFMIKFARMGLQKINAHLAIQELKELLVRIRVLAMMASLMMETNEACVNCHYSWFLFLKI